MMIDFISHLFSPFGLRFQLRPNRAGEPEASICCVIKGLQSRQGGMAAPLNALQMKASGSCKIQDIVFSIGKME